MQSVFSASVSGSAMMPATAAAKSVVDSTGADVGAVFGFDLRAFRPPPSARFADTFSVEPVQAAVQAGSTDGRNALICSDAEASLADCRSGGCGIVTRRARFKRLARTCFLRGVFVSAVEFGDDRTRLIVARQSSTSVMARRCRRLSLCSSAFDTTISGLTDSQPLRTHPVQNLRMACRSLFRVLAAMSSVSVSDSHHSTRLGTMSRSDRKPHSAQRRFVSRSASLMWRGE